MHFTMMMAQSARVVGLLAVLWHCAAADESHHPLVAAQRHIKAGMAKFREARTTADVLACLKEYDRAEELDHSITPYLWQRGLAYFFEDAVEQGAEYIGNLGVLVRGAMSLLKEDTNPAMFH